MPERIIMFSSCNADAGSGCGTFALLVDQTTGKLPPFTAADAVPNSGDDLARLISSFLQEGIDSRRGTQLRPASIAALRYACRQELRSERHCRLSGGVAS